MLSASLSLWLSLSPLLFPNNFIPSYCRWAFTMWQRTQLILHTITQRRKRCSFPPSWHTSRQGLQRELGVPLSHQLFEQDGADWLHYTPRSLLALSSEGVVTSLRIAVYQAATPESPCKRSLSPKTHIHTCNSFHPISGSC